MMKAGTLLLVGCILGILGEAVWVFYHAVCFCPTAVGG